MAVKDRIIEKIQSTGAISFHDFMEMALYYPGEGYYTSAGIKTGKEGDYYTSPYLGNIFGMMLAKQLEEMWLILHESSFTIVEYGAGNGALCYDILTCLEKNEELFKGLTYYIIEKSPVMIEKEKLMLKQFDNKVKWLNSIKEINGFSGCVLSNEVLDNFAVHKVVMQDKLMEAFVVYNNNFFEILRPAPAELEDYFHRFNITLSGNCCAEINLEAEAWMEEIAAVLKKGFVLTIDYGYPSYELYYPGRPGTILCYHNHAVNNDPFLNVGQQDITAHVNFSSLHYTGIKNGLHPCGFTSQSYFLNSLGLTDHLRNLEKSMKNSTADNSISSVSALITMGKKFKVLIQEKEVGPVPLSGMKFPLQLR